MNILPLLVSSAYSHFSGPLYVSRVWDMSKASMSPSS